MLRIYFKFSKQQIYIRISLKILFLKYQFKCHNLQVNALTIGITPLLPITTSKSIERKILFVFVDACYANYYSHTFNSLEQYSDTLYEMLLHFEKF